ncbi:MAG TPA: glycosyltransferase [Stellaceae bacterium]|jgi:hypothetical protein|nr:glycosyltransferase [Stellaceae bacterium]
MKRAFNVLLIVHTAAERAGTTREHVAALMRSTRHHVVKIDNAVAHIVNFADFDVIALHYSLVIANPAYLSDRVREKIVRFRGLKLVFIQDEYRWIDATAAAIRDLGISVVFSLIDPKTVRKVYHHAFLANVRFEHTLTGFVSPLLRDCRVPDYAARPIDVGYRARKLTSWVGSHSLQKWQIADAFCAGARRYGLTVDISTREEDRIYGRRWVRFLADCKATLGTESGASVLDYTDEIRCNVEAYLTQHPAAEFAELRDRFFADIDGRVMMNVISPRCFEAAALRTLMVMYPGEYGGILEPGRHYVVLEPDQSNLDEVVATIRSPARARAIIERAYREIACCDDFGFAALGRHFDRVIGAEGHAVRTGGTGVELDLRTRLRGALSGQAWRLRIRLAETAMRWEPVVRRWAKSVLPDRIYIRLGSSSRQLRRVAKRWILGV